MNSALSESISGATADIRPALGREFALGDWLVQPELNRLQQRNGGKQARHLEPRLTRLLCYLAANPERVLSRDDLVQELWPRVIVNENSLTRAVSELRKQLSLPHSELAYIETIPKKGYRLLLPVEATATEYRYRLGRGLLPSLLPDLGRPQQLLIAAFCLSLVMNFWVDLHQENQVPVFAEPILLADVVMNGEPDFFGGELTLSTAPGHVKLGNAGESGATPVVSGDNQHYAYIDYDHTGSTVYLGCLDTMEAPVAVFNSSDKLINLAWSPLGNALLFARYPQLTAAALFSDQENEPELYSLDLDSLVLRRLVEAPLLPKAQSGGDRNLT